MRTLLLLRRRSQIIFGAAQSPSLRPIDGNTTTTMHCVFRIPRRHFAGHNKWSKIKHKKGINDKARAAAFGKASRAIIRASKACRGDMDNLRLQSAVEHAKAIQLPKDRIEEAIEKGEESKGADNEADLSTVRYDSMMNFDGSNVAFIIQALTDNHNRTGQHVRTMVQKAGGELLVSNSNDYLFNFVGAVEVMRTPPDNSMGNACPEPEDYIIDWYDSLFACALDAVDCDIDVDERSGAALCVCPPTELNKLVTALNDEGFPVRRFEQRYMIKDPTMAIELKTDAAREQFDAFLDKLEEDEDVSRVYHNAAVEEEEEEEEDVEDENEEDSYDEAYFEEEDEKEEEEKKGPPFIRKKKKRRRG